VNPGFEAYAVVLWASMPLLRPFAMNEPTLRSTSSLLFRVAGAVIKLPNPQLLERVMLSQHRTSSHDFVEHEREAMRQAYDVSRVDSMCPIPRVFSTGEAVRVFRGLRISQREAEALAEWSVVYHWVPGVQVGFFDETKWKYTYLFHVGKLEKQWRGEFEHLRHACYEMNRSGIFHNDLAPQNILADVTRCRFHIIDFGAAFLDCCTQWEQPAINFIDEWYGQALGREGFQLREACGELRKTGVSKDFDDLDHHASRLFG